MKQEQSFLAQVGECPSCKGTMYIRYWKDSDSLYGNHRDCADKKDCGYTASWTCDKLRGTLQGVTFLRSNRVADSPDGPTQMVEGPETLN